MIYREHLDASGRFLALAVRGVRTESESEELLALYRSLRDDTCRDLAKRNQVQALVAQALSESVPSQELDPEWSRILQVNEHRVIALKDALTHVVHRFEALDCQFAVIENAGVMFGTSMTLAAFCARDFDLLVSGISRETLEQVLRSQRFLPRDRRNRPTNRVEFYRETARGETQWLNIGYEPFDRMWVPLPHNDRAAVWLSRRTCSSRFKTIWVLSPTDSLVLVAIHTSLHSFIRAPGIRLHADVDRLIRDTSIDWELFVEEALALGMPTRVFVSLAMAGGLLGTPVPAEILWRLYPGTKRWSRIQRLLKSEGIVANGGKKLVGAKAIALDALLDDRGILPWMATALYPPRDWMRQHFDRDDTTSPLRLHLNRIYRALTQWRPE